jgi:hypothetical protein
MTQTSKTDPKARLAALFARGTTKVLIEFLLTIEAKPRTQETTLVRAWLIEELERRCPAASAAVEKVFEDSVNAVTNGEPEPKVDYVAVLVAAVLAETTR